MMAHDTHCPLEEKDKKTKTKTKWLKDPTCAIFLKMIWLKDIKYDVSGWIFGDAPEVMHRRWCTGGEAPGVKHQGWCTGGDAPGGDAPGMMHRGWCNEDATRMKWGWNEDATWMQWWGCNVYQDQDKDQLADLSIAISSSSKYARTQCQMSRFLDQFVRDCIIIWSY